MCLWSFHVRSCNRCSEIILWHRKVSRRPWAWVFLACFLFSDEPGLLQMIIFRLCTNADDAGPQLTGRGHLPEAQMALMPVRQVFHPSPCGLHRTSLSRQAADSHMWPGWERRFVSTSCQPAAPSPPDHQAVHNCMQSSQEPQPRTTVVYIVIVIIP